MLVYAAGAWSTSGVLFDARRGCDRIRPTYHCAARHTAEPVSVPLDTPTYHCAVQSILEGAAGVDCCFGLPTPTRKGMPGGVGEGRVFLLS